MPPPPKSLPLHRRIEWATAWAPALCLLMLFTSFVWQLIGDTRWATWFLIAAIVFSVLTVAAIAEQDLRRGGNRGEG